jgi:hypothetical protein
LEVRGITLLPALAPTQLSPFYFPSTFPGS